MVVNGEVLGYRSDCYHSDQWPPNSRARSFEGIITPGYRGTGWEEVETKLSREEVHWAACYNRAAMSKRTPIYLDYAQYARHKGKIVMQQ